MEFSERELKQKTIEKTARDLIGFVQAAAKQGSWDSPFSEDSEEDSYKKLLSTITGANDVPRWFTVSVSAVSRILTISPTEGYECALMLLEAAKRAKEIHQKVAASTMVFDMLNGVNPVLPMGYAIANGAAR